MEPVNNLIYDYCIQNKVAIKFSSEEELQILHGLFNMPKESMYIWKSGAWVSYTELRTSPNFRTTMQIKGVFDMEYIALTAKDFFTLALPNKSILESIK